MTNWNDVFIYSDGLLIWKNDKIDKRGRPTKFRRGDFAGSARPDGYVGIVHEYKKIPTTSNCLGDAQWKNT